MREIDVAEFQLQCLELLDSLDQAGLLITKHGRPLASVFPHPRRCGHLLGRLRGQVEVHGDLLSTGTEWNV